jgi:hypothetical protein
MLLIDDGWVGKFLLPCHLDRYQVRSNKNENEGEPSLSNVDF